MRDGFIFYSSFYECIEELDESDQLEVYRAICQYALTGVMPDCKGAARAIMKLITPQIDANNKRRENGKKGAEANNKAATERQHVGNDTATERQDADTVAPKEKVKEKEKVKAKEKEKETERPVARFVKPTVDEIRAYCEERNNGIDPQTFFDFYEGKGWKVGNTGMKDWKACVRTWEARRRGEPPARAVKKGNRFNDNFEPRAYDYEDLETQLLKASMR